MPKFFIDKEDISDKITLQGDNMHHIINVLRCGIGEEIVVCDGLGYDYKIRISEVIGDRVICDILDKITNENEPIVKITLFQGLPKGDKLSLIVEKCIEAGVHEIIPISLSRCIVKLDKKDFEKKLQRLKKVSLSAAKQCERGIIPHVGGLITLEELIKMKDKFDLFIFPYELEKNVTLKDKLKRFNGKSIGIIIGPEGGFDDLEAKLLIENGILPVSLGKRILRTETAGLATVLNILYELN